MNPAAIGAASRSASPASVVPRRDELVTGEAVVLDLPVVGFGSRLLGGLIDIFVFTLVLVLCVILFMRTVATASLPLDRALARAIIVVLVAMVTLVAPALIEVVTHGRSLGKLICGTRVVRNDHGPLAPQHSIVRAVVGLVEIWAMTGIPAAFTLLVTPRTQRLGDLAAGTIVVKDRVPLVLPPPVPMPPQLIPWAQACDLGAVPPRLAMSARQFLLRRNQLSPQARNQLGHDLAAQACACVSPPPPPAHPEDVLAAVLAERARRDLLRWQRDTARWNRLTHAGARR